MGGAPASLVLAAVLLIAAWDPLAAQSQRPSRADSVPLSADYSVLDGWEADDHQAAFAAFQRSCDKIQSVASAREAKGKSPGKEIESLLDVCRAARAMEEPVGKAAARTFFETFFEPKRVTQNGGRAFLTGYFEPELKGDRKQSERYPIPVLAKPDDLVPLFPDRHRAAHNHELVAGRKTSKGIVAYADRKQIEAGALSGRGLEILYLADRFDAYIMHVQGSGKVVLPDGQAVRLAYAAKNGHPYTSIGKILIDRGAITKEAMSLSALEAWARAHPQEAERLMWENKSYIFFRELEGWQPELGPLGGQGVPLTPGRSLAVDASIHDLGTPMWVDVPGLESVTGKPFRRLMVAQDVGSAIKGAGRGDIFWGSGQAAGDVAGETRHAGTFWTFVPRR